MYGGKGFNELYLDAGRDNPLGYRRP